ncbi:hypothetical protein Dimus_035271 [Dionaea muscipula]
MRRSMVQAGSEEITALSHSSGGDERDDDRRSTRTLLALGFEGGSQFSSEQSLLKIGKRRLPSSYPRFQRTLNAWQDCFASAYLPCKFLVPVALFELRVSLFHKGACFLGRLVVLSLFHE